MQEVIILSANGDAYIGSKKRRLEQDEVSHEIEALPTPDAWGVEPANAKEVGHLRVAKGKISFVRLNISVRRLSGNDYYDEEDEQTEFNPAEHDPADRVIGDDRKRKVQNRENNVDLFALENQLKNRLTSMKNPNNEKSVEQEGDGLDKAREYMHVDYRSAKDAEKVRFELSEKTKRLMFSLTELGVITVLLCIIEILPAFGLPMPSVFLPDKSPVAYLLLELAALILAAYISLSDIIGGLKKILKRKCSTRTVIAVTIITEMLHIIYMLAVSVTTHGSISNSFAAPICLAVWIYTFNRMLATIRVARGFNFIIKRGEKYAVAAADDSPVAADLRVASGSQNSKISYVVPVRHLDSYFQNACRDDSCSLMMSRVYPYFLIACIATGLIGALRGALSGSGFFSAGLSAMCASLVACVPITGLLCMEIPLCRAVKAQLSKGALLNGWNAVEKFGDTDTLALNTTDLFPRGSIRVRKAVTLSEMSIPQVTAAAASVVIASGGCLAEVFSSLIEDEKNLIGNADSITYENEMGISGWVNEKRILVGNRSMMETHRVIIPGGGLARLDEFEAMKKRPGHQVLYVAVNNRMEGVFLLEYKASNAIRNALVQLISDGTNIMVYTCDANINVRLLTDVFDIPSRYISILDNDGSRVYDSVTYTAEEEHEALLATNGTLRALSGGIRAAVKLKENQNLGMMIQAICFGMGFLFVAGLSCISSYAIDAAQIIVMQLVFVLISLISLVKAI